jgi:hypothetical protein
MALSIIDCIAADLHLRDVDDNGYCNACGEQASNAWRCQDCSRPVLRYRGTYDTSCVHCGAQYNAGGQRLRDDWRGNPSLYDDEIDDLEGYERQHAGDW